MRNRACGLGGAGGGTEEVVLGGVWPGGHTFSCGCYVCYHLQSAAHG